MWHPSFLARLTATWGIENWLLRDIIFIIYLQSLQFPFINIQYVIRKYETIKISSSIKMICRNHRKMTSNRIATVINYIVLIINKWAYDSSFICLSVYRLSLLYPYMFIAVRIHQIFTKSLFIRKRNMGSLAKIGP